MGPVGTGIVFVVLVAIWVAYFVQYWSRRREHLATARSVEAFAEAMRVLERRPALRAPAGHRVSSAYAMSPARVVSARPAPRPQVIAKPRPMTPSPSRAGATAMSTPAPTRPSARPTRPPRTRRSVDSVRMSPTRKVRGLALLGSLLATLVLVALAALSVLLWWAPLIGVGAVVASFLWLRSGVRSEAAARRDAARRRRSRRSVAPPRPEGIGGSTAGGPIAKGPVAGGTHGTAAPQTSAPSESGEVDESELVERTTVDADLEDRPDAWRPVPVPPPTYTLKAKAERPAPPAPEVQVPEEQGRPDSAGEADAGRTAAYGT